MRKKQFVSRVVASNCNMNDFPVDLKEDSAQVVDQHLEIVKVPSTPPVFHVTADGLTTLPDGTPVVEPVDPSSQRPLDTLPSKMYKCVINPLIDVIKCTSCATRLHPGITPLKVHPVLKVILCKRCSNFYSNQRFLKDSTGKDENCRWCADGGDLICCDYCSNAFCKRCIKRNLGRSLLRTIESLGTTDLWKCFVCDRSPTLALRQQCAEIMYAAQESLAVQRRRLENRLKGTQVRLGPTSKPRVFAEPKNSDAAIGVGTSLNSVPQLLPGTPQRFPLEKISDILSAANQTTQIAQQNLGTNNTSPVLSNILQLLGQTLSSSVIRPTKAAGSERSIQQTARQWTTRSGFSAGRQTSMNRTETIKVNPYEAPFFCQSSKPSLDASSLLKQIASINETNIHAALKATRRCVDSFSADLLQLEKKISSAAKPSDITDVIRTFQNMYRYHLLARLANLSNRMREELPHVTSFESSKNACEVQSHPLLSPSSSVNPVTIDLTDDSPVTYPSKSADSTSSSEPAEGKKSAIFPATCAHTSNSDQIELVDSQSSGKQLAVSSTAIDSQGPYGVADPPSAKRRCIRSSDHSDRGCVIKSELPTMLTADKHALLPASDDHPWPAFDSSVSDISNSLPCSGSQPAFITDEQDNEVEILTTEPNNEPTQPDESDDVQLSETPDNHGSGKCTPSTKASHDAKLFDILPIQESSVFLEDIGPHIGDTYVVNLNDRSKHSLNPDLVASVSTTHSITDAEPDSDAELSSEISALERACGHLPNSRKGKFGRSSLNRENKDENEASASRSKRKLTCDLNVWNVEEDYGENGLDDKPHGWCSPSFTSDGKQSLRSALLHEAQSDCYFDLKYREQLLQSSSGESANEQSGHEDTDQQTDGDGNEGQKNEQTSADSKTENRCLYTGLCRSLVKSFDKDGEKVKRSGTLNRGKLSDGERSTNSSGKMSGVDQSEGLSRLTDKWDTETVESSNSDDSHSAASLGGRKRETSTKEHEKNDSEGESDESWVDVKLSRSARKAVGKSVLKELDTSDASQSADSVEVSTIQKKRCSKSRRRARVRKLSDDDDDDKKIVSDVDATGEASEELSHTDAEGSDKEKKGRRRIRKIKSQARLSQATKTAEAEERERRRRIALRQKQYNDCILQERDGLDIVTKMLVLEKSPDDSRPLVQVHSDILKHMKPHQVEAVQFLWDCVIESIERQKQSSSKEQTNGAILAHCMGLGKTLSVIAFIHTLLTHSDLLHIERCLVLCPVNTLLNWKHEWEIWLPENSAIDVFELASKMDFKQRVDVLKHWFRRGGILLLGYDMFRNFVTPRGRKARLKSTRNSVNEALLDPGPDVVICDEGHVLRNDKSGLSKAISQIRTLKRIVLTGTPLQNNLNEYHAMVNFVKPNLLGTAKEFSNRFANPIRNGQHSNSTARDVSIMKKRAHVLYKTLDGCIQRKDYNALTKYLPPRYEFVVMCRLSPIQCELYRAYLQVRADRGLADKSDVTQPDRKKTLFADQQTLYRIVTHPFLLRSHEIREARRMLLEDDGLTESSDETPTTEDEQDDEDSNDSSVNTTSTDVEKLVNEPNSETTTTSKHQRVTRSQIKGATVGSNEDVICLDSDSSPFSNHAKTCDDATGATTCNYADLWWHKLYKDELDWTLDAGGKLEGLFRILKKCMDIGDKVLVFTQSLLSLDLLERFLGELHRQWLVKQGAPDVLPEGETRPRPDLSAYFSDVGDNTWVRGLDYERMDGSMNAVVRKDLQHRFNRKANTRLRLFLISTRAGGLGINLVSANRLILFDASWNPSNDVQSIFRSYRFGQTKPVYIYRLIAQGTMEEKIYDRQVTKQSLSLRVIDERQVGRHFTNTDLLALYTFDPDVWDPAAADQRPTPKLPKDRLLADMLSEFPYLISNYHEHDSLLEHREDEGLTEEERQEAWREYEEEKRLGMSLAQHQRLMQQQEMINQAQSQMQNWRSLHFQQLQQQWLNARAPANVAVRPQFPHNPLMGASYNPTPNPAQYRPVLPSFPPDPTFSNQASVSLNQKIANSPSPYPFLFEKYRALILKTRPSLAADPLQLEGIVLSHVLEAMARESRAKLPLPITSVPETQTEKPSSLH